MRRNRFFMITAMLSILMLSSCHTKQEPEANTHSDKITLGLKVFTEAGMDSTRLADTVFLNIMRCSGQVDVLPEGRQLMSSPIGGMVSGFNALEGDKVGKGSVLFSVSNPELTDMQYAYLEAKAQLELYAQQVQRARNLAEGDAASKRELQTAEAAYATAKARYEALQQKMNLMRLNPEKNGIVSKLAFQTPFSGIVAKRHASNGQFVMADQSVVELVDESKKVLHIEVMGTQRSGLEEGQDVLLLGSDGINKDVQASILRISPLADPASSAVSVTAVFNSGDVSRLPIGSFVQAGVVTNARAVKYLPATAIIPKEGKQYVLVFEGITENDIVLQPVEIKTGELNGALVEVQNPEAIEGKVVLSKGGFQLLQ